MKHNNDKVIVTVYLYNKNKLFLSYKLTNIFTRLFPSIKKPKHKKASQIFTRLYGFFFNQRSSVKKNSIDSISNLKSRLLRSNNKNKIPGKAFKSLNLTPDLYLTEKNQNKIINPDNTPMAQAVLADNYLNKLLVKLKKKSLAVWLKAKKAGQGKKIKKPSISRIKTRLGLSHQRS